MSPCYYCTIYLHGYIHHILIFETFILMWNLSLYWYHVTLSITYNIIDTNVVCQVKTYTRTSREWWKTQKSPASLKNKKPWQNFKDFTPRIRSKVLTQQEQLLKTLWDNDDLIITHCDKSMVPSIIKLEKYISVEFSEIISDTTTYKRLLSDKWKCSSEKCDTSSVM